MAARDGRHVSLRYKSCFERMRFFSEVGKEGF